MPANNFPPALPPDFSEWAPRLGYQVEPDGRVYVLEQGTKRYIPPWQVWNASNIASIDKAVAAGTPPADAVKALQADPARQAYQLPGSDPNSAWHFMYTAGGPFTIRSTWDPKKGTYEGSVDWLTLLTTIGAGGVIGAGVAAAVGGGAAAGSAATAPIDLSAAGAAPGALATGLIDTAASSPAWVPATAAAATGGTLAGLSTRGGPNANDDPLRPEPGQPGSPDNPLRSTATDNSGEVLEGTSSAPTPIPTGAAPTDAAPTLITDPDPVDPVRRTSLIPGIDNKSLLGSIITSALTFAQSKANADAAKTASQQEIDAANKALDLQNQQFNLSRGDYLNRQAYTQQQITGLAPYQDIGTGALSNLRSLTGMAPRPGLANTPPVASLPPPVVPSGTLSSLSTSPDAAGRRPPTSGTPTGQVAQPRMITMQDPTTGETRQLPAEQEQHWTQLGARRIA